MNLWEGQWLRRGQTGKGSMGSKRSNKLTNHIQQFKLFLLNIELKLKFLYYTLHATLQKVVECIFALGYSRLSTIIGQ